MKLPRLPSLFAALAVSSSLVALAAADAQVRLTEFSWRAELKAPADAPLVRVELPATALGALQSRSYEDVRVFDNVGQALPIALLPLPNRNATETAGATVPALPLHQISTQGERMTARVEVRGRGKGGVQQLQIQWSNVPVTGAVWQAALFDLRNVKDSIVALDVNLSLPDNALVHMQASTSSTLQHWQNLPTTGPLYHFAGPGAPHNTRLQFASAQSLHEQFLLLQWPANAGVQVQAVRPQLVTAAPAPLLVKAGLPIGVPASNGQGLDWTLPPGAQVQSVQWTLPAANQLRIFQLQGRRDSAAVGHPSQAWESLGTVVVYHLVQGDVVRQNEPYRLPPGAWKTLRLRDWPAGTSPALESLQASMELQPVRLAFLANGHSPYTLAVGRAETPPVALPLSTLIAAAATAPDAWPQATIGATVTVSTGQAKRFGDRWRDFFEDNKMHTGLLWLVLALGAIALAGAAYKLLRSTGDSSDVDPESPKVS